MFSPVNVFYLVLCHRNLKPSCPRFHNLWLFQVLFHRMVRGCNPKHIYLGVRPTELSITPWTQLASDTQRNMLPSLPFLLLLLGVAVHKKKLLKSHLYLSGSQATWIYTAYSKNKGVKAQKESLTCIWELPGHSNPCSSTVTGAVNSRHSWEGCLASSTI